MKGLATTSRSSTIFNGSDGKRRGDGPLTTFAPSFGSYIEARALEQQLVRVPIGDVAARMRTYGRVGDDTVDGAPLGLGIEALRVETKHQHLVEARAVAHRAGRRIHRPIEGLLAVERPVVWFQGLGRGC